MTLPVLNSLWVGDRLSYIERLCITSAMHLGHDFILWSYEPERLKGVPAGTTLRDAAEVMPRERLLTYADSGSVALGANFWRYELLAQGHGYWVDMDFYFIRPLDYRSDYVFCWEHEGWINNALLRAPADSAMVHDLLTIPQPNRCPPWYGPRRRLGYYWQRLTGGPMGLEDYPWGTFSSSLVTHAARRNGLLGHALSPDHFYALRWKDARMLYGPPAGIEAMLTDNTRALHMWHSRLVGLKEKQPEPGTYMHQICAALDIDTRD